MADPEQTIKEAGAPEDAAVKEGLPDRREKAAARRQAHEAEAHAYNPADDIFDRARLLGPDAEHITGYQAHVVAGALHGNDADEFTRGEVVKLIEEYHGREITPVE